MANMSYCRFENTANDFNDCLTELQEAWEERYTTLEEYMESLSSNQERWSLEKLARIAAEFCEVYNSMENSNA